MKVFKYKLDVARVDGQGSVSLEMPLNARVLSAAAIERGLFIWAMVDPDKATERRHFRVIPTGHPLPDEAADSMVFIDTVLIPPVSAYGAVLGPTMVFHIFEEL